jgi:sugar lactone lactonase YvrE/tetratricopeptide (TPR) repeat protein
MSSTNRIRIRIVLKVVCLATLLASSCGAAGVDLNNPTALAFDHSGNLFVADHAAETIFKLAPDGTRSVFVTGVRLSEGSGLAFDAADNLFVLSPSGEYHVGGTILKFSPDGTRSTFATGVGLPYSLAIDSSGNLFVSDWDTGSIYKLTPKGEKSTFATTEIAAKILACDQAGNLFAGVPLKHSIFKYEPGGAKSDFATDIIVNTLAIDKAGNVYVGDTGNTIFKFTPAGAKSDFAKVTTSPRGFAFDSSGNLFVVESFSGAISKFASDGAESVFLAGRPAPEPEEEEEAESETDSSAGLPQKYAKDYLIARSTMSPDKKFAVIYPTDDYYQSADNAKDYVVALQPFRILGALQAEEPYFQHQSHGGISAEWSDDSSVALITLDGKWGPRDVFLVEFRNGKPNRMTNILRKAHDLLPPNSRKAIFVEDTTFQLDSTSRVVIDANVHTSPNDLGLSPDAWSGHVEATWDVKQAKFTSKEVSGRKRGAVAYRNRGQSAAEEKQSSPEDIQKAIGLTSKGWDYYLSLAWYHLFDRNPREAIAASLKALELSPHNAAMIKVTLAHGYLFDNQFEKAKAIYLQNKDAKLRDDERTFNQAVLDDFKELQDVGITHPDMEKIKALLTSETEAR